MKKILVNYNYTPDKDFVGDDYLIYDRSDDGIDHLKDFDKSKIIYQENMGQVDYPKLCYLVDNYDNLPEVFLWGKTNLLKTDPNPDAHVSPHIYITKEEYDKVKDNKFFTPLLTQNHKTYSDNNGMRCYYQGGIFQERNDDWYYNGLGGKYFANYREFAQEFQLPCPVYVPFAPGGNYILTRECVHRYAKDYYKKMASILPYAREPAEAFMCERAYYQLWK